MIRRTAPAKVTSAKAHREMRKWDNRTDWVPMNSGLVPIRGERTNLTAISAFSGAGNGDIGIDQAGWDVVGAADMNPLSAVAHQKRLDTDVACLDLSQAPPSYMPHADAYFGSASCRTATYAGGSADRDYEQQYFGEPDKLADAREHLLMEEIVRAVSDEQFIRMKPFKYVVIENVTEIVTDWKPWPEFYKAMTAQGYHVEVLAWNSRFSHDNDHLAAGQDRDRAYIICTYRGPMKAFRVPIPDLSLIRPPAWCWNEDKVTAAKAVYKDTDQNRNRPRGLKVGEYSKHYVFTCEDCGKVCDPLSLSAIDSLQPDRKMTKIKDRKAAGLRQLSETSEARTRNAIAKVVLPQLAEAGENPTQLERGFSITLEGPRREKRPRGLIERMPTLTQRTQDAIGRVAPLNFLTLMNGGGSDTGARNVDVEPANTVVGGGNHHVFGRYLPKRPMITELTGAEPPEGSISFISPYYSNSTPVPVSKDMPTLDCNTALPTVTGVDRFAHVRLRAEALKHFKELQEKHKFTAADVPEEMFQETELGVITPDEGGAFMDEPYGQPVLGGNKRLAMQLHGLANSVRTICMIFQELTYAMYPEVRPADRLPDVEKILAHHRAEMMRQLDAGQNRISVSLEMAQSRLLVPDSALHDEVTQTERRQAASARRKEARDMAKLRRANGIVISARGRKEYHLDADPDTGVPDLSELNPKGKGTKHADRDQLGFDFEIPEAGPSSFGMEL